MNYVIWNEPTQQTLPAVTHVAADKPVEKQTVEVVFAPTPPEAANRIVLQASAFEQAVGGAGLAWQVIPHLGQSGAAVLALPQGRPSTTVEDGVHLKYRVTTESRATWKVALHLSPTVDTTGQNGIHVGVSLDGGPVQTLNAHIIPTAGAAHTPEQQAWVEAVIQNRHGVEVEFAEIAAGQHTLEVWRLDDNAVLEEIEIHLQ